LAFSRLKGALLPMKKYEKECKPVGRVHPSEYCTLVHMSLRQMDRHGP
jgi:hypothetical protein